VYIIFLASLAGFLTVQPSGISQNFHPKTDRQELPSGKYSCRPTVRKKGSFLTTGSCRLVPDGWLSGTVFLTVFSPFLTVSSRQERLVFW